MADCGVLKPIEETRCLIREGFLLTKSNFLIVSWDGRGFLAERFLGVLEHSNLLLESFFGLNHKNIKLELQSLCTILCSKFLPFKKGGFGAFYSLEYQSCLLLKNKLIQDFEYKKIFNSDRVNRQKLLISLPI